MTECPAPEQLEALLAGRLDANETDRIEAHIDTCDGCRVALGQLAELSRETVREGPARPARPELPSRPAPPRTDTIDRYRIKRTLGKGGMGVALLAEDADLQRDVVIKLLHASNDDDERLQQRLLREAQAMAQVSHPNVVPIYDVGVHDHQVFLAMEYLDGGDLAHWLTKPRSPREVIEVFVAAARGLAAAHAAGLVHRDFKPQNVLLGAGGVVKVSDFGLARPDLDTPSGPPSAERLLDTPITRTGSMLGTPAYMAPEQITNPNVDARADQFSFCVALYEGVYGARPFDGKDTAEILHNTLTSTLPERSRSSRRVPRRVRRVLERGLAAAPDARFPSMDAVIAALAPRSRRLAWLAGAAAVAALAVGGVVIATHSSRPDLCADDPSALAWTADRGATLGDPEAAAALDRYAETWRAGHRDACLATRERGDQSEAVMDRRMLCLHQRAVELEALVAALPQMPVEARASRARQLPSPDSCRHLDALGAYIASGDPAQRAELEAIARDTARITNLIADGQLAAAAAMTDELVARAERTGNQPIIADAHYARVKATASTRSLADTVQELELVERIADAAHYDRTRAAALVELVTRLTDDGKLDDAARWASLARGAVDRDPGDRWLDSTLSESLGNLDVARGDLPSAEREFRRAVDRGEGIDAANARFSLARFYERQSLHDKALAELAITRDWLAAHYPDTLPTAFAIDAMATVSLAKHDNRAAASLATAALAMLTKLHAAPPIRAMVAMTRARAAYKLGDTAGAVASMTEAAELGAALEGTLGEVAHLQFATAHYADAYDTFARMLEIARRRAGGDDHADVVSALNFMAVMKQRQHDLADAALLLARARTIIEKVQPRSALHADTLTRIGSVEIARRNYAAAATVLEQALTLRSRSQTHEHTAWTKVELANALWGTGHRPRAIALAREALANDEDPDAVDKARAFLVDHGGV